MKVKTLLLLIILLLFVTACSSEPEEPIATATPTAAEVQLTQAAQTIIAQLTQSAAGIPSATPLPPTVPPTATLTLQPPTPTGPTPTASETSPPTTTALPTFTSTPTYLPGDPRGELGASDWQANFNQSSDWFTFDGENASILRKNGTLVLTAKNKDIREIWSLSYPVLSNFYLEYTVITGPVCQGRDRYGMVVRAPDPNSGYVFGVSCDGSFRLRYWDGVEFTVLQDWTSSELINTGSAVFNRLGIEAQGEKLTLFVNGGSLAELEDNSLAEGKFGAFIKGEGTAGFRVTVTEVRYWDFEK
ncbi:MAG: hypothetical protein ISR58_00630 [Anaerolineales bacterium]|nr:hypothetical protein [Chloroflexota bacterium]MBL6979668.1 hypothetical protein [Anaerolineales bacterium]